MNKVNVETYRTVLVVVSQSRVTMSNHLEWLTKLGPDAEPMVCGLQAMHDELYEMGLALLEQARDLDPKFEPPSGVVLTEEQLAKSRHDEYDAESTATTE